MQTAQDWEGDDLAACILCWYESGFLLRNLLPNALMRPGSVEVVDIVYQYPFELLLLQDEQVIEALSAHAAQKPFKDGIGPWCVVGRFEKLDATRLGKPRKTHPKLAIVIADEVLRTRAISGGLPQLLRRPSVGGRSCDAHVDHSPRVEFDDEEGEERTEEKLSHWQEVAGPDLLGMAVNERPPRLSLWSCATDLPHVLLNGAFAHVNAQLQEFTTNPFCSP
jgi:hypothetical protein